MFAVGKPNRSFSSGSHIFSSVIIFRTMNTHFTYSAPLHDHYMTLVSVVSVNWYTALQF